MKDIYSRSAFVWLMSLWVCMCAALSARAEIVDLGVLLPGETYHFPEFKEVRATYTPSVTGPARFLWSGNPLTLYSDPGHSPESAVFGTHAYTQAGQMMSYECLEAGHTYHVYSAMTIMATDLRITEGDAGIELVKCDPDIDPESPDYYGGRFSVSKNYRINLDFNYPVTVGNCFLIAGDHRERVAPMVSNASVSFDVNDVIMAYYNDGILKEGDTMTLRVLQVKDASNPDNKFGENGKLEIDFVMAGKPAELVDTRGFTAGKVDNPFASYYFAGDEAAEMTLVFDRPIGRQTAPVAQVTYGNPDNLDLGIYKENVPGVVDGCEVTFDFSGKLRRRADMIPGADLSLLPAELYVSYNSITTDDGQFAYTGMISNPTGFGASYVINELLYSVAADFSPARGSALKEGDRMEIWVMNGSRIRFDSICIDYISAGETKTIAVGKEDVETMVDPDSMTGDDMLFYFTVPAFSADPGSVLSLYMAGLVCADGLDHSADVVGEFICGAAAVGGLDAGNDTERGDVFDVAGKRVLRDATRSDMNRLESGLYIFNGKKIAVN